ncbi:LytTR family transcriptional regulator [Aliigemmobacter aestuarii]|uniref:LytTR family transcriptional regulator n=1 Tax=Aliigemmobacter aestuarii TaxID=1445661 RepID=A0A4S3MU16_9RHOB|nr:LytTR family DNA-binding domain-containing protein [Gemmobacter aestuarii]THD85011.1 LytTR family transcriptional regulator [Gemmobacter aestuarii]
MFGLSGPFGSFQALDLWPRMAFWAGAALVAVLLGLIVDAFVTEIMGLRGFGRGAMMTSALVTALLTGPLLLVCEQMFGAHLSLMDYSAEFGVFVFCVTLSAAAVRLALKTGNALPDAFTLAEAEPHSTSDPRSPRLLERLPEEVRAEVVSVSVRDHYVDVKTEAGKASLLMRFSDAIAELEGVDGDQVHRSHWVAWNHVTGAERVGNKLAVLMRCGRRIPVSRNHRDKLEERGLI